jgi:hypothetical protein
LVASTLAGQSGDSRTGWAGIRRRWRPEPEERGRAPARSVSHAGHSWRSRTRPEPGRRARRMLPLPRSKLEIGVMLVSSSSASFQRRRPPVMETSRIAAGLMEIVRSTSSTAGAAAAGPPAPRLDGRRAVRRLPGMYRQPRDTCTAARRRTARQGARVAPTLTRAQRCHYGGKMVPARSVATALNIVGHTSESLCSEAASTALPGATCRIDRVHPAGESQTGRGIQMLLDEAGRGRALSA